MQFRCMKPIFIRDLITHKLTRPALRDSVHYQLRQVKAIVVHWTANQSKGANAQANRNYFNNGAPGPGGTFRPASAHYLVDSNTIIQALPDTEVGFHCGDKPLGQYKPAGKEMIKGTRLTPNYFTIGLELCANADGNWTETCDNGAMLAATLLYKHGLDLANLLRHFDVTGKKCPLPMIQEWAWMAFVKNVMIYLQQLDALNLHAAIVDTDELNVRKGPTAKYPVAYTLLKNERVLVEEIPALGWVSIGQDQWVKANFLRPV